MVEKLDVKRRDKPTTPEVADVDTPKPVTAGAIDRVVDLAFNPSNEKIREMTYIDRSQSKLLPQLDVFALAWQYVI